MTHYFSSAGPRWFGGVEACPSSGSPSPLSPPLCKVFVKAVPDTGQKSTNNIHMAPRLSPQPWTKEWQVQKNHVEFFILRHCLSTLTPSWACSARPELCQADPDRAQLEQQAWPTQKTHSFILLQKKMALGCIVQKTSYEKDDKVTSKNRLRGKWTHPFQSEIHCAPGCCFS